MIICDIERMIICDMERMIIYDMECMIIYDIVRIEKLKMVELLICSYTTTKLWNQLPKAGFVFWFFVFFWQSTNFCLLSSEEISLESHKNLDHFLM